MLRWLRRVQRCFNRLSTACMPLPVVFAVSLPRFIGMGPFAGSARALQAIPASTPDLQFRLPLLWLDPSIHILDQKRRHPPLLSTSASISKRRHAYLTCRKPPARWRVKLVCARRRKQYHPSSRGAVLQNPGPLLACYLIRGLQKPGSRLVAVHSSGIGSRESWRR